MHHLAIAKMLGVAAGHCPFTKSAGLSTQAYLRTAMEPETPALNWTGLPGALLKLADPVTLPPRTGTVTDACPLAPWRLTLPLKESEERGAGARGGRERPGRLDIVLFEDIQVGRATMAKRLVLTKQCAWPLSRLLHHNAGR